jgi:hypothetical protein
MPTIFLAAVFDNIDNLSPKTIDNLLKVNIIPAVDLASASPMMPLVVLASPSVIMP